MPSELLAILETMKPVLEATTDAICIFDAAGSQVYANRAHEAMIRRAKKEVISDLSQIRQAGQVIGKVAVYHDLSEINRLKRELDKLNDRLRKASPVITFDSIIGKDTALLHTIKIAKGAATTPATILIRGESGTGKEIFANAIHSASSRRLERFLKVNCSSIPEELLESELFGYKAGAFTGALRSGKAGLFQEAHKGTLFLDEIGDISLRMQVKLLRVLQEKEVMPVGASEAVKVDVRILCATNKPLEEMIEKGQFREDLYYRLNVIPIHIPPLRERREDIGAICMYLVGKYNQVYGREVETVSEDALALLKVQEWRGNVRELENVLSRVMIGMEQTARTIGLGDLAGLFPAAGVGIEEHVVTGRVADAGVAAEPPGRDTVGPAGPGAAGSQSQGAGGRFVADEFSAQQGAEESLSHEPSQEPWQTARSPQPPQTAPPQKLKELMDNVERSYIQQALERNGGDKNKAAYELGLPLRTLYYRCSRLGL